jgi:hypothetical protein
MRRHGTQLLLLLLAPGTDGATSDRSEGLAAAARLPAVDCGRQLVLLAARRLAEEDSMMDGPSGVVVMQRVDVLANAVITGSM